MLEPEEETEGNGYIFQAEFEQGEDVIYCADCGIYYGK